MRIDDSTYAEMGYKRGYKERTQSNSQIGVLLTQHLRDYARILGCHIAASPNERSRQPFKDSLVSVNKCIVLVDTFDRAIADMIQVVERGLSDE